MGTEIELLVATGAYAAIVAPPRDYAFAAQFPNWMVFAPGMAPVVAVAVTSVPWMATA